MSDPKPDIIDEFWRDIDSELARVSPVISASLSSGATEVELAKLESTIGFRLPWDIRRSLQIHNGQTSKNSFINGFRLLGTRGIEKSWLFYDDLGTDHLSIKKKFPPGVKGRYAWNREWLFALQELSGREVLMVDCSEAPEQSGPLFLWDSYLCPREVVTSNFLEFLKVVRDNLVGKTFSITGNEIDMPVGNNFG